MPSILEALCPVAAALPEMSVFSEESAKSIAIGLKRSGIRDVKGVAKKYLALSLLISLVFSPAVFACALLLTSNLLSSLAFALLSFALAFLFLKSLPASEAKRRAALIEADLPMALRAIGIEMGLRVPFEKCIADIAAGGYGISPEFGRAHAAISSGASVQTALSEVSGNIDSFSLKRAISQMLVAYEHGSKPDALMRTASELVSEQSAKTREYGNRMAFLGLAFVAVACLLPAFFLVFTIVSSAFLDFAFTPLHVWLAFLVFFPLLDALVLVFIQLGSPASLETRKAGLFGGSDEAEAALAGMELGAMRGMRLRETGPLVIGASVLAGICLLVLSLLSPVFLLLAILVVLAPPLAYFYLLYVSEKRTREIEERLPDVLFTAASLHKGISAERVISSIARAGYGALSDEFETAARQVAAGSSVPGALRKIGERNNSVLLSRAVLLISKGYESGADMYHALRESAEDILSLFALVRERRSILSLQKYTVIIGGAVLVPLILGSVFQVVGGLSSGLEGGFLQKSADAGAIQDAAALAAPVYLGIYALVSSLMVAKQEGDERRALIYFVFMLPLAEALFFLAKSANVFAMLA